MDYYSEQSQNTPPGKVIIVPNLFLVFSVICAILSCTCGCFILSSIFLDRYPYFSPSYQRGIKNK